MINIKQAREICDAATPEPWSVGEDEREAAATLRIQPVLKTTGKPFGKPVDVIMPFGRAFSDARFCAEARKLLPAALDEVETLRKLVLDACDRLEDTGIFPTKWRTWAESARAMVTGDK